jgi:hypothetical protein
VVAVVVLMRVVVIAAVLVKMVQFVLFGLATLVHFLLPTQVIYDEFIYPS